MYAPDTLDGLQSEPVQAPQPQPVNSAAPPHFEMVRPPGLRDAWAFVRPALDTMDPADGWLPEDVYMMLRSNGATLYMIYDGTGQQAGFFILRLIQEFDGPRVHIWILHATDADFDVMAEFSDALDQLARDAGAARLTFSTNRPGWHRRAPQYRFTPREITYERPLGAAGQMQAPTQPADAPDPAGGHHE